MVVIICIANIMMGATFHCAFAGIPLQSSHHVLRTISMIFEGLVSALILRYSTGLFVLPLDFLVAIVVHIILWNPLLNQVLKIVPAKDPRTGNTVYFRPLLYFLVPRSLLFDEKVKASMERIRSTSNVTMLFGFACTSSFSHVHSITQLLIDSFAQQIQFWLVFSIILTLLFSLVSSSCFLECARCMSILSTPSHQNNSDQTVCQ